MGRLLALADRAFKGTATSSKLQASLASAGVKLRPGEFGVVVAGMGVAGALVSFVFFPLVVSMIVLVGLPLASYYWMIRKGRKRRIALENQLPTVLQLLAGSLDSGASMLHAMEIVAQEGNPPLADEFARGGMELLLQSGDCGICRERCCRGRFAVEEAREDIGELCLLLDQLWARFVIHLLR